MLPFFWVPEEGARRREKRDHAPYVPVDSAKVHRSVTGEVVDYERIRARSNELGKRFKFEQIAIDRWNATQLATQLDDDGFEIVSFGQGYASMSAPTKGLEELVLSRKLRHAGHPVLRWMADNVAIEQYAADNWKPSKKKSQERIDGIVALVMAVDMATRHVEYKSPYSKRGMLFL